MRPSRSDSHGQARDRHGQSRDRHINSPPCGVPSVALAAVRREEEVRILTKENRRNSAGQTAVIKEVRWKNGFGTAGRPRH